MTGPAYATANFTAARRLRPVLAACALLLGSALAPFASGVEAGSAVPAGQLQDLANLTAERRALTAEMEQYQQTLDLLQTDGTSPEQSLNPAVRKLAAEMVSIKERLITITEREITLLQEEIIAAKIESSDSPEMESKPLRGHALGYSLEQEKENVERLRSLLAEYYTELQEAARTMPSEEELAQRQAAQQDAAKLAKIPFSADKVRLNGSEGSTALTQITLRLADQNIPESRRDIAPICSIRTRLFGSLIGSERRSLKPVGKNHYIAKIRLQPGDTTVRIQDDRWEIRLPEDMSASEYIITLYRPPGAEAELHIFSIDDLLAEDEPHIPAWLPEDVQLNTQAG